MNKFRFNVKNALLAFKFLAGYKSNKIEYPAIVRHLNKKYGQPLLVDNFQNLDNWMVKNRSEWGSALPGNLCTFVKENIITGRNSGNKTLVIITTPEQATGKDWNGEDATKPISSGLVSSKFLVRPGQVVSATVNTSLSYPGSWFAFWLMKKDVPGDNRYREIDIFEKFMEKEGQKKYTITIHGGMKDSRELLNFAYQLFHINEATLTFTCELHQHMARIFVNGILICTAEEPDFEGEYYVMFNDAPSTHDGKVKEEEIVKSLPRFMEVIDFRIYNL